MFNYLSAEIYKVVRRPALWVCLAGIFAGEVLLLYIERISSSAVMNFAQGVIFVPRLLMVGFLAAFLISDLVYSNQAKTGTMKNEVAFGLTRLQIYLGKLCSMWVVSIVAVVVVLALYLIPCYLLLDHRAGVIEAMWGLGASLLAALPLWLGAQATCCALCFATRSEGLVWTLSIGIFLAGSTIVNIAVALLGLGPFGPLCEFLVHMTSWLPDSLCQVLFLIPEFNWEGRYPELVSISVDIIQQCWIVGAFWVFVPTFLSLSNFYRKEIH